MMFTILFSALAIITLPIWSTFVDLERRPPYQQHVYRAASGAGMIAMAIFLSVEVSVFLEFPYWQALGAQNIPALYWVPAGVLAVLLLTGILWLSVYVKKAARSRIQRETIPAVWAAVQTVLSTALLIWIAPLELVHDITGRPTPEFVHDSPRLEILLVAVVLWWVVTSTLKLTFFARGATLPAPDPFGRPPGPAQGGQHGGRRRA